MYDKSAGLYDAIYTRVKNYQDEATTVLKWIRRYSPEAKTVLNVACGTGEHDRYLKNEFLVDGLDLNPTFVEAARKKNPNGRYHVADMIEFNLNKKYDAVVCLFSSIGYVRTVENLQRTIQSFSRHLNPGGVVIVEPWFTAEKWPTGHPHLKTVDEDGFKVARLNISETRDGVSYMLLHYLVGTHEGVTHFTEEHLMGLFSIADTKAAFARAGLKVEYDEQGIFGRGLYVGKLE